MAAKDVGFWLFLLLLFGPLLLAPWRAFFFFLLVVKLWVGSLLLEQRSLPPLQL